MHYGGGLGLAYAALGLISFLAIAGVIQTTGGISLTAFRFTQLAKMQFLHDQNHALELQKGARAINHISQGLGLFSAFLIGLLAIGFFC